MTSAIGSTSPRSDGAAVRTRRAATWSTPAVRKQKPVGSSRPFAGTGVRLVWSRSVDDPDVVGIYGVFEIDMEHCPNCGGALKIIAAILEQPVIEKILSHLGLQARAPPRAAARGQPLQAA